MGTEKLGLFVIVNVSYILCDFEINHQGTIRSFGLSSKQNARCLKMTEKISFNIASEASYVYILSIHTS